MQGVVRASTDDMLRAAHAWRTLLDSPEASQQDRARFEAWLREDSRHADFYDQAVTFWAALGHLDQDDLDDAVSRPSWCERFSAWGASLRSARGKPTYRWVAGGAVAAVFVVALVALITPSHDAAREQDVAAVQTDVTRYQSATGQVRTITLSDGTVVMLGARTILETAFTQDRRVVRLLDGAALFEVAHDPSKPFVVEAGELEAQALGTQFDVRSSAGVYRVAVAEGEVAVSYPLMIDSKPTYLLNKKTLHAGEQVAADRQAGMSDIQRVAVDRIGAWRDDRLIYNGAKLSELIADANRYATQPVEIAMGSESIASLQIRGAFNGRDIDGMLSNLELILPVVIDRSQPDLVRIRAR